MSVTLRARDTVTNLLAGGEEILFTCRIRSKSLA